MTLLTSETEYQSAITRTLQIFHAEENSREAEELANLLVLVKEYEEKNIVLPSML